MTGVSSFHARHATPALAAPKRIRPLRTQLALTTALSLLLGLQSTPLAFAAGGAGGKGDYGHSAGTGGDYGVAGTAGGGAKTYQTQTGGGGGGGGANASGGAGGIGGLGESGGTAGTAGAAGGGAGGDGGNGTSGTNSAGGGGGGGGGGDGATGATYTNASGITIAGGKGGNGGNGGASAPGASQVTGGGGGGGAGGNGLTLLGTTATNAGTITGGTGGNGGTGAFAGNGGDGGIGIYSSSGTAATITNSGTITGGNGGAAGSIATTGDYLARGGAAGTTGAGSAGILGANLTIVNTGKISGGTSGDGTTQADAITFTGGTNSLTLSAGGTTGTLNGEIGITGALSIDPGTASGSIVTLSNLIHGTGSVEKTGDGTLVVTGADTYTGGTTISAGVLQIGANGTAGSIPGDVVDNATLAFDRSDIVTFAGVISGTGAVTQIGDGTTILTGTNTYTGGTTISAGVLQIGAGGTAGSITGDVTDNGTLAFDRSDAVTFAGAISGSGAVSQIGSGTTTLTGTNTYTGQTTVSAGALVVDGGAIAQTQGITLDGDLTVQNGGTVYSTGYLSSGTVAGTSSLTVTGSGSSLTLNNDLDLGNVSGSTTTVKVTDAGSLSTSNGILGVASGSTANVTVDGSGSSWTLNHYLSVGETGTGTLTISNGGSVNDADIYYDANASIGTNAGAIGTVVVTGSKWSLSTNDYTLYVGQSGTGTLQVADGGSATVASGYGSIVVAANSGSTGTLVIGAADGTDGSSTGAGTISAASIDLATSGASVVFNHDETAYTFATQIYGVGSVKVESGTTILTGENTYTGGTTISAGTLQIGDGGTAGSLAGDVVNSSALVFDRADSLTFDGTISGTGTVSQIGSGTTILSGTNTYTGGTTISAGTLQVGDGKTSGSITGDVADNGTLAFDRSDSVTFSGVVSGAGALTQAGSGTTILTGTNTYTGGTTISAGTLQIGDGGTAGAIAGNVVNSGALVFDRSDSLTFDGGISGTGTIAQIGGGALTLSGANTYSGGTTLASGSIVVANDAALGTGTVAMAEGTMLAFASGANYAIGNAITLSGDPTFATPTGTTDGISGAISDGNVAGELEKTGAGTLVLTGTNTYTGGTTIAAGTLQIGNGGTAGSIVGNVTDNATLAFDRSDTYTFAGTISGTGAVNQIGSGTTILTGTNTYTGKTTIDAGTLEVDGSIAASTTTVNSGGTLTGTGETGALSVASGGTLAAGTTSNPYGTLTVAGSLTFAAGSFYNVSISPTGNSRTNVLGTTTISGATVRVLAGSGSYSVNKSYTILTSTTGVSGRFATAVATNLAFLAPTLSYSADAVTLTLVKNATFRSAAVTSAQASLASALDNAVNSVKPGTSGAKVVNALNRLSTSQARAAYDSLSGEGLTAAQNVANRSSQLFNASIFDQTTFYSSAPSANSITLYDPSPIRELADLPSGKVQPTMPATPNRSWRAWASGFGGIETINGSATGTAGQRNTIYGGTLGVDYALTPNYLVGVALGGSSGDFRVADRATSGSTAGGHVALYDLANFGAFYGASSAAFSSFTNRTTRIVSGFGGLGGETERGDFASNEVRARLEFGRHLSGYGASLTPFVALELAQLRSNGFTESSMQGAGLFRLAVSGQSQASAPAFLGLRLQQVMAIGNGMVLTPTLQLAFVHEFAPYRSQIGTIADLPGSTFQVDGARAASNAAQVKAGGELSIGRNSAIFANFDGEFSGVSQVYAGRGGFRYAW